jgi:hypothetical protein
LQEKRNLNIPAEVCWFLPANLKNKRFASNLSYIKEEFK